MEIHTDDTVCCPPGIAWYHTVIVIADVFYAVKSVVELFGSLIAHARRTVAAVFGLNNVNKHAVEHTVAVSFRRKRQNADLLHHDHNHDEKDRQRCADDGHPADDRLCAHVVEYFCYFRFHVGRVS